MRKHSIFALALLTPVLIGLTGCVTSSPYGNFIENTAAANDQKIADDVVKKLVTLYPPASTRFDLQHGTPDFFGSTLIESLRANGYAVLEFKPEPKIGSVDNADNADQVHTAEPSSPSLPLSYIMDQAKGSNLYRVSLVINHGQSLARAYQLQEGTIYPAGYWVHKE
jgi:hypothetical protein